MQKIEELGKGSYILRIRLDSVKIIKVGKLGEFHFAKGYYFYCGSAQGKNGLKNRLSRYLRKEKKYHWHSDYLIGEGIIDIIYYSEGEENREHDFASALSQSPDFRIAFEHFGSSDCKCISHLYYAENDLDVIGRIISNVDKLIISN